MADSFRLRLVMDIEKWGQGIVGHLLVSAAAL